MGTKASCLEDEAQTKSEIEKGFQIAGVTRDTCGKKIKDPEKKRISETFIGCSWIGRL